MDHIESDDRFEKELKKLINRYGKEQDSNTPDFILAKYLSDCLAAYNDASYAKKKWYGKSVEKLKEKTLGPPGRFR